MSVPAARWWRWLLPTTLLAVGALGLIALDRQPRSTLVVATRATTSSALAAPQPRPMAAWRLQVQLDRDLRPPGPEWVLYEGAQPGNGYELRWQPERLAFAVSRGAEPTVLGIAHLDHAPADVVFARRGLHVSVVADGREVLRCLDLVPPPAPTMWGFQAAAAMAETVIALHDDSHLLTPAERTLVGGDAAAIQAVARDHGREDHAIAQARAALTLDPEKDTQAADAAIADAELAASALGDTMPEHASLVAWMAWARLRVACARGDAVACARALALAEAAMTRAPAAGRGDALKPAVAVELPGLLARALVPLAARATQRPAGPAPVAAATADRLTWMGLLAETAYLAIDAADRAAAGDDGLTHWQLRLVAHAADCLQVKGPQPTPAEAPAWLISRWRAFAGRDPRVGDKEFPPVPLGWLERDPLAAVVDRLADAARFAPLPAVSVRARILDALERGERDDALACLKDAPPREAALSRAALALSGVGGADAALAALTTASGGQPALAQRDPLAYALTRLLRRRAARARPLAPDPNAADAAPVHLGDEPRLAVDLPPALAPYERLLSGTAQATQDVWTVDASVLPPAQALAAALAMQETCGTDADWSLLSKLPCYTLPLELLAPPRETASKPPR